MDEINQFIKDYSKELILGNAAYFIGAGISVDSKLPDWSSLLQPFVQKIGLHDLKDKDLPLVAQYVINDEGGNRGPFINSLTARLRDNFSPNLKHEYIAKTNVKTIWTTNYDNLIEQSFSKHISDIKFNDDSISRTTNNAEVEIIKMHGCIFNSHRDDIVITQSDYEDFFINRPATAERLRLDLLQKSFLFIGYGYGDPNIKNIITEARRLSGNNTRRHYLITKDKNSSEFDLWCKNLRRYGIVVIKISDYEQLTEILHKLSLKSRGNSVFISGSHETDNNEDVLEIGRYLANRPDIILNDGQSTGPMRIATNIFMEVAVNSKFDISRRLCFFPNPYAANPEFSNNIDLIPTLKKWRVSLLRATALMIFVDGGMGTVAEVDVALDMGCIVIPFLRDKDKITWQLLENPIINDKLAKINSSYISKVKSGTVERTDVIQVIEELFK